jgi:hypothetical protein
MASLASSPARAYVIFRTDVGGATTIGACDAALECALLQENACLTGQWRN